MIDIKKVEKEAREKVRLEREEKAIKEIKLKIEELERARGIVRNLEKEYELLIKEIGDRAL